MSDGGSYYQQGDASAGAGSGYGGGGGGGDGGAGASQAGDGWYQEDGGYYEEDGDSQEGDGGYYQDDFAPLPSDAIFVGHMHFGAGPNIWGEIGSRLAEPIAAGRVSWQLSVYDSGGGLAHSDGGIVGEIPPGDWVYVASDLPTLADDTYSVALDADLEGTAYDFEPGWFRIVGGELYTVAEEGSPHVAFAATPTVEGGAVCYSAVNDGTGPAAAGTVVDRVEIHQGFFAMVPGFTFQSELVLGDVLEVGATYTGRFDLPHDIPPGDYVADVSVDVAGLGPKHSVAFTV
jgi:hypothetical protein